MHCRKSSCQVFVPALDGSLTAISLCLHHHRQSAGEQNSVCHPFKRIYDICADVSLLMKILHYGFLCSDSPAHLFSSSTHISKDEYSHMSLMSRRSRRFSFATDLRHQRLVWILWQRLNILRLRRLMELSSSLLDKGTCTRIGEVCLSILKALIKAGQSIVAGNEESFVRLGKREFEPSYLNARMNRLLKQRQELRNCDQIGIDAVARAGDVFFYRRIFLRQVNHLICQFNKWAYKEEASAPNNVKNEPACGNGESETVDAESRTYQVCLDALKVVSMKPVIRSLQSTRHDLQNIVRLMEEEFFGLLEKCLLLRKTAKAFQPSLPSEWVASPDSFDQSRVVLPPEHGDAAAHTISGSHVGVNISETPGLTVAQSDALDWGNFRDDFMSDVDEIESTWSLPDAESDEGGGSNCNAAGNVSYKSAFRASTCSSPQSYPISMRQYLPLHQSISPPVTSRLEAQTNAQFKYFVESTDPRLFAASVDATPQWDETWVSPSVDGYLCRYDRTQDFTPLLVPASRLLSPSDPNGPLLYDVYCRTLAEISTNPEELKHLKGSVLLGGRDEFRAEHTEPELYLKDELNMRSAMEDGVLQDETDIDGIGGTQDFCLMVGAFSSSPKRTCFVGRVELYNTIELACFAQLLCTLVWARFSDRDGFIEPFAALR